MNKVFLCVLMVTFFCNASQRHHNRETIIERIAEIVQTFTDSHDYGLVLTAHIPVEGRAPVDLVILTEEHYQYMRDQVNSLLIRNYGYGFE